MVNVGTVNNKIHGILWDSGISIRFSMMHCDSSFSFQCVCVCAYGKEHWPFHTTFFSTNLCQKKARKLLQTGAIEKVTRFSRSREISNITPSHYRRNLCHHFYCFSFLGILWMHFCPAFSLESDSAIVAKGTEHLTRKRALVTNSKSHPSIMLILWTMGICFIQVHL